MSIYQPYTYLIGWSKLRRFYYGVRFAKNCHPNDLWKTYFTSSKYVEAFRKEHGEPDVIEVRRTFESEKLARGWEHKVLRRMKVVNEDRFLNMTDHKSFPHRVGWKHSKESCEKMSQSQKGKPKSEETKQRISKSKSGVKRSPEAREAIRKAMKKRWDDRKAAGLICRLGSECRN